MACALPRTEASPSKTSHTWIMLGDMIWNRFIAPTVRVLHIHVVVRACVVRCSHVSRRSVVVTTFEHVVQLLELRAMAMLCGRRANNTACAHSMPWLARPVLTRARIRSGTGDNIRRMNPAYQPAQPKTQEPMCNQSNRRKKNLHVANTRK